MSERRAVFLWWFGWAAAPVRAAVIPDGSTLPREAGAPPIPKNDPGSKHHPGSVDLDASATPASHGQPTSAHKGGRVEPNRRPVVQHRPPGVDTTASVSGVPVRALQPLPRTKAPDSLWILALVIAVAVLGAGSQLRKSREN